MSSETEYKPKVGDLVCILQESWEYCGYGTVVENYSGNMFKVYWHDLKKFFYEYSEDLMPLEEVDIQKCRKFMALRRRTLDLYDL